MTEKIKATVLKSDCAEHPAVLAWTEISGGAIVPDRIDVLRVGTKSATYRLFGAGPSGTSIIVQCCEMRKAALERRVHEEILPHLPVTVPQYYGFKPAGPDAVWIFYEDVGDQRYVDTDPAQRRLAGRWIGLLHSAGSRVAAARSLPAAGLARALGYLRANRATINENIANPALGAGDVDLLRRIVADLDALESDWSRVERACAGVPPTLVHSDFRPKNAFVRSGPDGLRIFPIDWETAGWGVPAADLTRIDLAAYVAAIDPDWWPGPTIADVERLAAAGAVFRYLASIFWMVPQLAYREELYLIKPIWTISLAHQSLCTAVRKLRTIA
jgi:aminoglycoside phosphotransferase (APT) family kinase protein